MGFYTSLFAILFSAACFSQSQDCGPKGNKQNGTYTEYHPNCSKKSEIHYKNGLPDGSYREWMENGALKAYGTYADGLREGTWRRYDTLLSSSYKIVPGRGNYKYSEYYYEHGKLVKAYQYVSSGDSLAPKNSEQFITYQKDTLIKQLVYHPNGRLNKESYVTPQMQMDSVTRIWDEDGRLTSENFYRKGYSTKDVSYGAGHTSVIFYDAKNNKTSMKQTDLSGKVLYEEFYDSKGKITKKRGTKR